VPVRWPGPGDAAELLVTSELLPRARPTAAPSAPVDVIRAHRTRKESTWLSTRHRGLARRVAELVNFHARLEAENPFDMR
jgi:hypothetical protein